jgi:hypothetical protein
VPSTNAHRVADFVRRPIRAKDALLPTCSPTANLKRSCLPARLLVQPPWLQLQPILPVLAALAAWRMWHFSVGLASSTVRQLSPAQVAVRKSRPRVESALAHHLHLPGPEALLGAEARRGDWALGLVARIAVVLFTATAEPQSQYRSTAVPQNVQRTEDRHSTCNKVLMHGSQTDRSARRTRPIDRPLSHIDRPSRSLSRRRCSL